MKHLVPHPLAAALWIAVNASLGALPAQAQSQSKEAAVTKGVTTPKVAVAALGSVGTDLSTVGPSMNLTIGKSTLMRLPSAITRISLGNPSVADVTLISTTELYLLGKTYGSTNLIIWSKGAGPTAIDLNVNIDFERMQAKILELLPKETGIQVRPAADSVILTGVVSSAAKARAAEDIANAFVRDVNKSLVMPIAAGDAKVAAGTKMQVSSAGAAGATEAAGAKVVNLLQIAEAQQVMLEVTVAEVSKTLMDKLGSTFSARQNNGNWSFGISSLLGSSGAALFSAIKNGNSGVTIDAEKNDGLIKILAEPNIVAISGQEASFLAGGKIFIPVGRTNEAGGTTITLEEKEYGVGVKFTPTVLEGGRIHLKVAPEVSELSQTGSPFTTVGGTTTILPSFTTRRAQTSIQLMDGQSLAIAGLIKNNVKQAVDRVPGLGEVPIVGALFRSTEFQGDRTELMFVITPRLIKPLDPNYILPTDSFTPPSRSELYFGNKLEGSGNQDVPADRRQAPANTAPVNAIGGMEVK